MTVFIDGLNNGIRVNMAWVAPHDFKTYGAKADILPHKVLTCKGTSSWSIK